MIYQTDERLGPYLNHWGCHICSILHKVEKRNKVTFDWTQVLAVYKDGMSRGYIQQEVQDVHGNPDDGCSVLDGKALYNLAAQYKGISELAGAYSHQESSYVPAPNDEEILELKREGYNGSHFVAGNGHTGDTMQSEIEFDPIEGGSHCARDGFINTKRIITFA
jgi:hypothetical protein